MNIYNINEIPPHLKQYFKPAPQLGNEPTPQEYVKALATALQGALRVLKTTGTLWVVIGDSRASARPGSRDPARWPAQSRNDHKPTLDKRKMGYRVGELIGVPWMFAFAMREAGWLLRQDIIYHKRNPMPESCKTRCTSSHEHIFLFSKQDKYYFDYKAIREKGVYPAGTKGGKGSARRASEPGVSARPVEYKVYDGFRNKRDVWTVSTRPSQVPGHFATYPPELIEPAVLAGCPAGGIVLDPYMGSGTTAVVAERHGRRWLGIELNAQYAAAATARIAAERTGETPCSI